MSSFSYLEAPAFQKSGAEVRTNLKAELGLAPAVSHLH